MVQKPVSLRIDHRAVTRRARALLLRLEDEASARRLFRHFAAKAFLAVSEMRGSLGRLGSSDRVTWEVEIKRIEASLRKIRQGSW